MTICYQIMNNFLLDLFLYNFLTFVVILFKISLN